MRVIKVENYNEVSERAAAMIASQVILQPDCVLGLATGSTPIGTYKKLIQWYNEGKVDFSEVMSINLDEYIGLDGSSEQSYRYFMNHNLFEHININIAKTFVPDGMAKNGEEACSLYDERIKNAGGIDLQLLGIGNNGHIGFNEPSDCFLECTHIVELEESTIAANARFFRSEEEVPKAAITMGMGGIMRAKKVLLIANGVQKAAIIKKAMEGPVTPKIPASILQLHSDCTIIYSEE